MASTYLTRTFSTATNRKIWTWSAWVKKTSLVSDHTNALFGSWYDSNNRSVIRFNGNRLQFQDTAGTVDVLTSKHFRDTNAWYHIVVAVDTTQATASNRVKIYVNGEQETAFDTANYPAQNSNTEFQGAVAHYINARKSSSVDSIAETVYSHVHFCDGTQLAPTVFGSTDSTTGEWQINTSPSFTLGNNGFSILKDGNTITDQSSNSNNWTLGGGTLTKTEDNPSNIFDTINPNFAKTGGVAGRDSNIRIFINNGNTRLSTDVALWTTMLGSIPMFSGKYYWECKRTYEGSPSNHLARVGIEPLDTAGTTLGSPVGTNTDSINYQSEGGGLKGNSSYSGTYASWQSNNDIVQIAVDMDNHYIYFGKNGTWQNSGDPTSGSSGTGGIAITAGKGYVNGFTVHRGGGSAVEINQC